MPENDPLGDRRRASEEDYFRRKDRELVEKMRQVSAAAEARRELGTKTGLPDADVEELQKLGFTPETVTLLPFVPLLQVAWAEGGVSDAERTLIVKLARARGIAEGSAADRQLSAWLSNRPDQQVFARASRLIGAMLEGGMGSEQGLSADDLVRHCESIAAASGGILGINRVSAEERALLASIAATLKARPG
jgi:hypothetical protein